MAGGMPTANPDGRRSKQKLTILDMHLDGRPVRSLAHPEVQILAFAGLEKHDIVAVVQLCEFVELVEFCLCVEFRFLAAVRQERVDIVQEMAMSVFEGRK